MSNNGDDERELLRRRRRERALSADYTVGYSKPDPKHQFKRGNTIGSRPRRKCPSKKGLSIFDRVAEESVSVSKRGRKITMSRDEFIIRIVGNAAENGDLKAQKLWMNMRRSSQLESSSRTSHTEDQVDYAALVRQRLETMAQRLKEYNVDGAAPHQDGAGRDKEVEPKRPQEDEGEPS